MKLFSDKYINQYKILDTAQIGFEFEFYSNISYYKTLEALNIALKPVKVWGFRRYHSNFQPDRLNFKIEPDLSGGSSMVELVTGPMTYHEARTYLIKCLKFIKDNGYTNSRSSIHINLSFTKESDKKLMNLNLLKHILNMDEDLIYKYFPKRKNNIYAKSVKKIIPFKEYDYSSVPINVIKNTLRLPEDKYFGINFSHMDELETARLEYRYIGGKDYEKKPNEILELMDYFIVSTYNNINADFTQEDEDLLIDFLGKNISNFKNFIHYNKFLSEFPTIQLQIDQNGAYDYVNAYYPKVYKQLYSLIEGTENLQTCIVNYYTTTQRLEVIEAEIKGSLPLSDIDFINCKIHAGMYEKCQFVHSEISKVDISKSNVHDCEIKESKLTKTKLESSQIDDCFIMNCYINSVVSGGVLRSGDLGPYAEISDSTKVVSAEDNFFNTKLNEDDEDLKKKIIKQNVGKI